MNSPNPVLGNVFQALADPTRRAVVHRLGAGPASTKALAEPFDNGASVVYAAPQRVGG